MSAMDAPAGLTKAASGEDHAPRAGWRFLDPGEARRSLSDVYATIPVPVAGSWLRRLLLRLRTRRSSSL